MIHRARILDNGLDSVGITDVAGDKMQMCRVTRTEPAKVPLNARSVQVIEDDDVLTIRAVVVG